MEKKLDAILSKGEGSARRAIRPLRPHEQVIAAVRKKFGPWSERSGGWVTAEFIPATVKGEGEYVLTASDDFSPRFLMTLGFSREDIRDIRVSRMAQWNVPPEVMEEVAYRKLKLPPLQLSHMSPHELTREIRNMEGHEYSRVREVPHRASGKEEQTSFVVTVKATTSRSTFQGTGRSKREIARTAFEGKQFYIPEPMMHRALGIKEGRAL
jgi:hypothetical protein